MGTRLRKLKMAVRGRRVWLAAALVLFAVPVPLAAQDFSPLEKLHLPTLGGKQFWADELFFHQWHIQRNAVTGRCRLLDGRNLHYASGSFHECRAKLDEIRRERDLPPMQGKAVVLLHGLFRSRASMNRLGTYLAKHGGYTVFSVGYPSTRRDVAGHARSLARVIENLDGIEEIHFVAHSMGNIVVRHYLGDQTSERSASGTAASTVVCRPDRRIGRFVMLGPPNHGSLVALTLAENKMFEVVTGEAVRQLGMDWAELEGKLATPECEFGIIAGGKGNEMGFNPLVPGDDDATVSVASTRLAGARDFVVVPLLHSFIIKDERVFEYTLRFLKKGHFISAAKRQPVVEE